MRFILVMIMAVAVWPTPAFAATPAQPTVDDFAISIPAEPLRINPGERFETSVRVVNRTAQSLKFKVTSVGLQPADEGVLQVVNESGIWSENVVFPEFVEVAAMSFAEVPIAGNVPASATPNIYFLGFAVEPVRGSTGSLDIRSRGANHLAVEVPGAVRRSLVIAEHRFPRLKVGDGFEGRIRVFNDGEATVRFRSQVRIDSAMGDKNLAIVQATKGATQDLLPQGRTKTLEYSWQSNQAFAVVTPTAEVTYNDGDQGLRPIVRQGPMVLVLHPLLAIGAGLITVVALAALAGRRPKKGLRETDPAPR